MVIHLNVMFCDQIKKEEVVVVVFKFGDMSCVHQHPWMHLNLNMILYTQSKNVVLGVIDSAFIADIVCLRNVYMLHRLAPNMKWKQRSGCIFGRFSRGHLLFDPMSFIFLSCRGSSGISVNICNYFCQPAVCDVTVAVRVAYIFLEVKREGETLLRILVRQRGTLGRDVWCDASVYCCRVVAVTLIINVKNLSV